MISRIFRLALSGLIFALAADRAQAIDPALGRYLSAKQQQIRDLSATITNPVPAIVWKFFDAARVDDWETASNLANRIELASRRYSRSADDAMTPALRTVIWPPISESWGAYGEFHSWDKRWLERFGRDIIQSIPRNSIYFGGTDPGRFVISALSDSQIDGRPFFTLTQNQLADSTYVDYLRVMYGRKMRTPTTDDLRRAFDEYTTNAQARMQHDEDFPDEPRQLKPGEGVRKLENGRIQVYGQVSVMAINALLVKQIFQDNPDREFYLEESFPLEWMYPHLIPHGLIFKLNRQPLARLSEKDVADDQDYWKKLVAEMLGGWLNEKTPLKQVADFADEYGLGKHLEAYPGDKVFGGDDSARKTYAKLRGSIAGVYAWRADHARDAEERDRMYQAADLAFRQAYAICPYSPEAIWRYVQLLTNHGRSDDAILLVKTSVRLEPEDEQLKALLSQLMKSR